MGTGRGEDGPWFPCGRWEEAQAVVCCSQRGEGPDLAWSAFWPGWGLGASGCLLAGEPAQPSVPVPILDRTHPCKAQGSLAPGCPEASPTAHVFTLGQASLWTGLTVPWTTRKSTSACLGRLLAPSRKQRLASSPGSGGPGGGRRGTRTLPPRVRLHPSGCTEGARPPHSHLGRLSLCVADNCSWVGAGSFPSH